jgi:hypothetical protein
MSHPTPSHLGALREGLALLRRHPALGLGLALLAMVLAQLGPALELAAGAGSNPILQPVFGFAGLLPLEMYFLPRLQARLDAETLDRAGNPREGWREAFDGRWVRTFLLRLGISVAIGFNLALGLALGLAIGFPIVAAFFFLPGILILTLFGWAPLRMLLRGDGVLEALRWSQSAMARHWPRIVQAVLGMLLVALLYQMGVVWAMDRLLPAPVPEQTLPALLRLRHPAFWAFNLLTGLLNLWLSCALLALYQRLEASVAGRATAA